MWATRAFSWCSTWCAAICAIAAIQVNYVRNITDIDDKIIQRAANNGESIDSLTARFIAAMDEDCTALGCERPDHEPRATAHLPDIIALIEELMRRESGLPRQRR